MQNVIMYRETFAAYGLNKKRNFLYSDYVELKGEKELANWMAEQLELNGCPESAVFAIDRELNMYVAMTDYEDDEIVITVFKHEWQMDLFAIVDGNKRLCCYALIEEIKPGVWKILEE